MTIAINCRRAVHLIGIGGAGMSPLAEVLARIGCRVTGSDRERSQATARLEERGITVQYGHEPDLVTGAEMVVYSSAIRPDNPERAWARDHGVAQVRRAEIVGDVMRMGMSIAVAGTHGKTTTTSLVTHLLSCCGPAPLALVGGVMRRPAPQPQVAAGTAVVVEADEFDRSFLSMYPTVAVVTTIEEEHLDIYRDLDDIKNAFIQFVNHAPFYGMAVVCTDDTNVRSIVPFLKPRVVTCGLDAGARYRASDVRREGAVTVFTAACDGAALGTVRLPLAGAHNVRNALCALAAVVETGTPFDAAAAAMASFGGVRRRMEIAGVEKGVTVIDDYAHHPGEIRAVIAALKTMEYKRIIAVFQPHLYTRTRDFMDMFAESLMPADVIVVAPIYRSREEPIEGVSAETIVNKARAAGHGSAHYVMQADQAAPLLAPVVRPGDAVVVMGAGDIWQVCAKLLKEIAHA